MRQGKKAIRLKETITVNGKAWVQESDFFFCLVLFMLFSFSVFYLFLDQARGFYRSDLSVHLSNAITTGGYSINNLFLKFFYSVAGAVGVATYLTLIVLGTVFCAGIWLKKQVDGEDKENSFQWSKALLISCAMCFLGGIYVPNVLPIFYLTPDYTGPGSAFSICMQPWHNPTYLLMRLFGILTLFLFYHIRSKYLTEGITMKDWLLFTAALTLTNAAKPNFIIAFAPAMLIVLLKDFIKTRGKSFLRAFVFGSAALCSAPILFVQKRMLFDADNIKGTVERGVALSSGPFVKLLQDGYLQPILVTGCAFFVFVTIAAFVDHKIDEEILFGWLMLVISLGEALFIIETGPRGFAGNFGWGVPFCAYALAVPCMKRVVLLRERLQRSTYCLLLTPLILMLFTGAAYFAHLLGGGDFIA